MMRVSSSCKTAVALAISLVSGASHSSAVTAVSDPVGFTTITAKPINNVPPANNPTGLNFISLSMVRPAAYQSTIPTTATVVGVPTPPQSATITFATNVFTDGQFGTSGSHYLEILNGSSAGFTTNITASSLNSLTVGDNIAPAIANDGTTTFRIRPYWDFNTAFGATNSAGFQASTSEAGADLIQIVNPINGSTASFFFNNTPGINHWVNTAAPNVDAGGTTIQPDVGLQVLRRGAGDLNFKLLGDVKTGRSILQIEAPANFVNVVPNPFPIDSVSLKDSGLQNAITGGFITTADTVRILDLERNALNDFFYDSSAGEWKSGLGDASLARIPSGGAAAVIRKSAVGNPSNWIAPQPAMVLGDTPLRFSSLGIVSRKSHATFGVAEINLPTTGASAVESRPLGSAHTIVFKFSNPIASGNVAVTAVTGPNPQIPSAIGVSTTISGNELTASLTNVNNQQRLVLTASNLTDSNGQSLVDANGQALASLTVPVRFLAGDVNESGGVTSGDLQSIKTYLNQPLRLTNFRADANFSGSVINSAELQAVKTNLNKLLPDL